jgi:hypothetical protein
MQYMAKAVKNLPGKMQAVLVKLEKRGLADQLSAA